MNVLSIPFLKSYLQANRGIDIFIHMLTKDELEQIAKLLESTKKRLTEKIETVDLKVEASHEFNKQAHAQILDIIAIEFFLRSVTRLIRR